MEDSHIIQKETWRKSISVEFLFGESWVPLYLFYQSNVFTPELEENKLKQLFSECRISLRYPPRWNRPR